MERSAGVRVAIAYPSDPAGTIPGGIETFIRGIINWAPAGFSFDVIGVTTDPAARPVGQWTTVNLGRGSYRSLPLFAIGEPGKQSRFPASLNHLLRLIPKRGWLRRDYDVIDMHRIEPAALFSGRDIALNAFFHQNMDVLRDAGADIRWRHLPGLYFWIEGLLMKRLSSVYAVREDAVAAFRERYASMADKFRFTPTWYDPDRFAPVSIEEKQRLRQERLAPLGVDSDDVVITSLGRLDKQKDPLLLLEAFARVRKTRSNARLLMIGDGVLRSAIEERIGALDLRQAVILAGLVNPADVADYLRASDLFALSSAYEGMPSASSTHIGI
ncbi:MAG: glycosyltransferase, partial [Pseudomonadota bacterium]